eukprot:TRINITY_DN7850_c0_g1_i1.p1 TRINITY_DN7850_c0_g1~~TRINITY_DN7850_c0_g1_i1.p1  ORF type:complete len:529 (+),score=85.81 TRINITY_DN7850_c0_g1_i1:72-1658(+)
MASVLFKIREPDPEQQERVYREQKDLGKSEVYAKAYANKIHEGDIFASYFAELRERRALNRNASVRAKAGGVTTPKVAKKRSPQDFTISKPLGEGAYSTVYMATEKDTGNEFAIKILDKIHIQKEKKEKYVITEKDVFNALDNPFIVKLHCTFQDARKLYFVIEYCAKGDLLTWINKLDCFDEACTQFYAAELVAALEHMHGCNIIHRDLKPENILLDDNMHIKLTDFGTSKILDKDSSNDRSESFVGTAFYVSPELLSDKIACKSSDLWALGVIIYQLLSGQVPFRGGNDYQTFKKITSLEYTVPQGFPEAAKDLVEKLLQRDPDQRLGSDAQGGFGPLKQHPFFKGVDWQTLSDQTPPKLEAFLPAVNPGDKPLHEHDAADDELADLEAAIFMKNMGSVDVVSKEDKERQAKLDKQKGSPWQPFLEPGELIIKTGLVDKRKGLFSKRRQLILLDTPRLIYIDPDNMEFKGEIPWSLQMMPQYKNMKTFFVHTPMRTYYLEDIDRESITWVDAIQQLLRHQRKTQSS